MRDIDQAETPSERLSVLEANFRHISKQLDAIVTTLDNRRIDQDALAKGFRENFAALQTHIEKRQATVDKTITDHNTEIAVIKAVGLVFLLGLSAMIGAGAIKFVFSPDQSAIQHPLSHEEPNRKP